MNFLTQATFSALQRRNQLMGTPTPTKPPLTSNRTFPTTPTTPSTPKKAPSTPKKAPSTPKKALSTPKKAPNAPKKAPRRPPVRRKKSSPAKGQKKAPIHFTRDKVSRYLKEGSAEGAPLDLRRKRKRQSRSPATSDTNSSTSTSVRSTTPSERRKTKRQKRRPLEFEYIETEEALERVVKHFGSQRVVGFDCKGLDLGRIGPLTYLALSSRHITVCIDIVQIKGIPDCLKALLENPGIIKVAHDCRSDSEALFTQFRVRLTNVFDTSVANMFERRRRGRRLGVFNSIEGVSRSTNRGERLPHYTLTSNGKTYNIDVAADKRKMQLIWDIEGRDLIWGCSPLSPYHQRYATLNSLLARDLQAYFRRLWSERIKTEREQRRFLGSFKAVCAYFALSRHRVDEERGPRITRGLRNRVTWSKHNGRAAIEAQLKKVEHWRWDDLLGGVKGPQKASEHGQGGPLPSRERRRKPRAKWKGLVDLINIKRANNANSANSHPLRRASVQTPQKSKGSP